MLFSATEATWSLPPYSGPFNVGTSLHEVPLDLCDQVEVPYCPKLTTLKYRIFYPTLESSGPHPRWASQQQIHGFAKFAGLPSLTSILNSTFSYMLSHIELPAISDAAVCPIEDSEKLPVIVFSHGLGGTDTSYSAICGNLASFGTIVFAIEHRDHSASSTIIHGSNGRLEQVEYVSPVNQADPDLRRRARYMLSHRDLELRLLLRRITDSERLVECPSIARLVDTDRLSLVGHSFGGATCLHLLDSLLEGPTLRIRNLDGTEMQIPDIIPECRIQAVVILDIWTQPLSRHIQVGHVPILHLVSTQFSKWPVNHDRLLALVRASKTSDSSAERFEMECDIIQDSLHLSQSDGGLLFPSLIKVVSGCKRTPSSLVHENVQKTLRFLHRHGILDTSDALERVLFPSQSPISSTEESLNKPDAVEAAAAAAAAASKSLRASWIPELWPFRSLVSSS